MEQRVGLNRGTLHTGERDVNVHSEGKSFMGRLHAHNEKVAFPSSIDLDVPRREDKRHRQKRFVASRRHVRVELAVVCCDPPLAWIPCKFGISSIASTTTNSNPSVASRGNTRPALLFVTPDCSASSQKMVETGRCCQRTVQPASSTCTAKAISVLSTSGTTSPGALPPWTAQTCSCLVAGTLARKLSVIEVSPFFYGFSRCRICHIAQLAVYQKKSAWLPAGRAGALRTIKIEGEGCLRIESES